MRLWISLSRRGISHVAVDFLSRRGHFACGCGFPFQEGHFACGCGFPFQEGHFACGCGFPFQGEHFACGFSLPGGGHFACGFSLPGGAFRMRFFPSRGSISHAAGARRGSIHSCEGHSPLLALLPSRPRRCSALWNVLLF